jgi:hypothetical protein
MPFKGYGKMGIKGEKGEKRVDYAFMSKLA